MHWLWSPSISVLDQGCFYGEQRGIRSEDLWKAKDFAKFINAKNKIYGTAHD
jgi:hypothetical protein